MTQKSGRAAAIIWQAWQSLTRIDELPADCRPADRVQGYAAQADVVRMSGQKVVGWKIAATSLAGQKHIGVDGPLAGPLLSRRVLESGAPVGTGNLRDGVGTGNAERDRQEDVPRHGGREVDVECQGAGGVSERVRDGGASR